MANEKEILEDFIKEQGSDEQRLLAGYEVVPTLNTLVKNFDVMVKEDNEIKELNS